MKKIFVINFSYDGSNYYGFQKQVKKNTIQKKIEEALLRITEQEIKITASGRTDTGVHAINQYAHFELDINIKPERLKKALNDILPKDIYIKKIETKKNFHARFDVKKKEYQYVINTGKYNVFENKYVYQLNRKLDIEKMRNASEFLVGEHNFKAFCKSNNKDDDVRTIFLIKIKEKNNKIFINILGSGFLRYMVRNIVGTLIEVGLGKLDEAEVEKILNSENRQKAGLKAPATGLYLKNVYYK